MAIANLAPWHLAPLRWASLSRARRITARLMVAASIVIGAAAPSLALANSDGVPYTFADFTAPFQFTYAIGSWQDKVQAVDGHVVLQGVPCDGGAGMQAPGDLSAYANFTPTIRLKTTAANTAKIIQIKLVDADGRTGAWRFTLPAPSNEFVAVMPKGASALSTPNVLANSKDPENPGSLDLTRVAQYQLLGDWSKASLDLQIDAITFVPPDAAVLAEREAYLVAQAEEAAQTARKIAEEKAKATTAREQAVRSYSHRTERSPEVVHVSMVAPDVLSLTIEAQRIVRSTISKYEPQPGDEKKIETWRDGTPRQAQLKRDGKPIGRLMGRELDWFANYERIEGDPLLEFITEDPTLYTISSTDDPAYASPVQPTAVHRKSKPIDVRLPGGAHPTRHSIYLKLPSKVQAGKTYAITIDKVNVKNPTQTFTAALQKVRSESVHVNQIGYRPDDAVKRAFLSVWLGTGGAVTFPDGLTFSIVNDATSESVFNGNVERVLAVDGKEELWVKPPKNYSGTAVYRMDLSSFSTPGKYRVYVDGIGCSYPFEIGQGVWEHAFLTQMKGLYNQRSGIDLGPPYTEFKRPRDFHPEDGAVATRSTYDVLTKGPNAYDFIAKGDTGEPVKDAWGGYHDAGDWNPRRVTHMRVTLTQLELCDLFPAYFNALKLNIPPTPGVPDMIAEALFEIDCFRRLQLPDGGIPHGIETQGDPLAGEVSWLSTHHLYVLAPNIRDSWLYAAVAARAAKVLKPFNAELAQAYQDSAAKAFRWAEEEYAKNGTNGIKDAAWEAIDARNLSAVILYELTDDKSYHDVFLQSTVMKQDGVDIYAWGAAIQSDAAFLYARLDDAKTDAVTKTRARAAIIDLAERSLRYAAGNAFNLTNRERGRPMFAGFFSTSGGMDLVRAHYLTGKPDYLAGAVASCQFQAGCNPNNIVYTTGLGANPVKVPLELDARSSGQPVPVGLTVFGNTDYFNWPNSFWDINLKFVNKPEYIWPDAYQWPLSEAYFDVWVLVSANEYVVETWAPNVLVWGYLAARPDAVNGAPQAAN